MRPALFRNVNCRNSFYARSSVSRFPVPDDFILWSVEYISYKPIFYESEVLNGKPWADPKIGKLICHFILRFSVLLVL